MPLFLLIVGVVLALLGVAGIVAGAPDWVLGLSIGATLITSGSIMLVGGLILIGLSQVLTTLLGLQRRLEMGAAAPAPVARAALAPPDDRPQGRQGPRPVAADAGEGEPPRVRRAPREPQPEQAGDEHPNAPRDAAISTDQPRPRRERPREAPAEEIARPRRPGLPQPPGDEMRRRGPATPPAFEGDEPPVRLRPRGENPREEIPRAIRRAMRRRASSCRFRPSRSRSAAKAAAEDPRRRPRLNRRRKRRSLIFRSSARPTPRPRATKARRRWCGRA